MCAGSARQAASQSSSTPATGESSSPTDYAEVDLGRGRPGRDGTELTLHDDGALTRRSVLPGGVRVITESVPGLRSASIGMWFGVGSRDEVPGQEGSTHFLEHLLFKGTARRDARAIAEAFDFIGGESNAATSKEHTSYYARVQGQDCLEALDVLADMVTSSLLDPKDVETERGVIISELADAADDPVDVAQEAFARAAFGEGTPLGRPIGGTPEAVAAVPRDVEEVCAVMVGEFERLAADGVSERELRRARGQIRGAMVLGGEDSLSRMGRLGRGEVVTGRLRSMEENLRLLDAVTAEQVRELAAWLVGRARARVLVGPRA